MTKTEIADEIDRIKQMVEQLDQAITKLAIAVEADEATEEAPAAKAKTATLEQVRAALTQLSSAKGAAVVKELLKEYGATKLSEVAEDRYFSLMVDAKDWGDD